MIRAWVVRVGQTNRRAAVFERPGAVALGWADVSGIGDLAEVERDALVAQLLAVGRNDDDADDQASQLIAFRDEVGDGDLIVALDARTGDAVLGTVVGPYAFEPENARGGDYYPHRHSMTVLGRVLAADVPDELAPSTRSPRALQRADDEAASGWALLGDQAVASAAKPAPAKRARKATKATAKAPAKPEAPPDRRCPGCGYSWPASQFAGGELCVGCRA